MKFPFRAIFLFMAFAFRAIFIYSYFFPHFPLMGQPEQLQPQDDFPALLSFISFIITAATAAAKSAPTTTVPILFIIQSSIKLTPLPCVIIIITHFFHRANYFFTTRRYFVAPYTAISLYPPQHRHVTPATPSRYPRTHRHHVTLGHKKRALSHDRAL